ncbi:efflux RND transporter periplasmic adaptor subunit [Polaribacter vadi]|uniref:efflux RND transporter periplasmic adaptor subunit n=1 Tax=Polaribacter TaxID=52959 RepID=UPI001C08E4CB|nr:MULTISPECIES: efflux RND transporter periplasmic adaptor subunit [Polaribacter]MBU3012877.1 efflux RND transporter periplasmic adaptor subunit [Polaribacter vadi]MDO6742693.1 efflux RND transporter periplasmic adaptor subunit [Polaribacter sp. 1_MG-2023]
MKNKNIAIYLGILAFGLLLGYFFFGNSSDKSTHNHNEVSTKSQMWTCSMHPQIMKSEPGDCPICGMDLIPAENSSDGLMANQFKLTENAMALANIQTSIVGNDKVENNGILLSGKIVENEEENAIQVSYFSGRIERLNINSTGIKVNKGQLLATIYSPELFAAQQELITASSLKETQPTLYKAVRNKLKLWKLSETQINQIETSGKVKENFPVYATVTGTVSEKLVEEGSSVKQGQPLFKIANFNTLWANFDVYENQIGLFKKGQEISITTNTNKVINAKVDFIDPVLDTKTRTVKLRVVLNNRNNLLKPGMFVEGKIKGINSDKGAIISIPASAVLWTGKRSVVYVKTNENAPVFEMREITLGNRIGNNYEVLKGLKNEDEIVTNGTFTVDAAAQLQGKKSMMNKKGGKVMTGHENHLGMAKNTSSITNSFNKNERIEVSEDFQNQLKTVFNAYIKLKDALVKEETNKSILASKKLLENISKVDMKLLKDNKTHTDWMSLVKEIKKATTSISTTSNIEEQRSHFKNLSLNLIKAIQIFGINTKVFVEFCPMANSNKGAYWLSKEEKVINPYYGDKMLTCGEVKQVIEQ